MSDTSSLHQVTLEQYPTSPHLAASVVCMACDNGDLGESSSSPQQRSSNSCLDLGCGTGMLSISAAFVADIVIAVDCDPDAIVTAQQNAASVELEDSIHFIQAQVKMKPLPPGMKSSNNNSHHKGGRGGGRGKGGRGRGRGRGGGRGSSSSPADASATTISTKDRIIMDDMDGIPLRDGCVDTVLVNPPFGTKPNNAGIDVQFLRTACRLARKAVYSFHKTSTRAYLLKTLEEWGYHGQVAAEMKFDIPNMYKFHKQKNVDVEVDLIRVTFDPVESVDDGEP